MLIYFVAYGTTITLLMPIPDAPDNLKAPRESSDSDMPNAALPSNDSSDSEWCTFLLQYYRRCKASDPSVTLRAIYPIARKKYDSLHTQCDFDLALIANRRKHKKKTRS